MKMAQLAQPCFRAVAETAWQRRLSKASRPCVLEQGRVTVIVMLSQSWMSPVTVPCF